MSRDRSGTITDVEFIKVQENNSKVYKFRLDSNPSEQLTISVKFTHDTPRPGRTAMIALYPEDSKWPLHVKEVIFDLSAS